MITVAVTVSNPTGLHARPAASLVALAKSFTSAITIKYGEKSANAKSILAVLTLGASQGASLTISTDGVDETAAAEQILEAFSNNLGDS